MSTARTPVGGDAPDDPSEESPDEALDDAVADPDTDVGDDHGDDDEDSEVDGTVDAIDADDTDPPGDDPEADTLVVDLEDDEPDEDAEDVDAEDGTDEDPVLGDELDAELEAEAAEMAPLVELPDRPYFSADEPAAATGPAPYTGDPITVRVRGRGKVPARRVRRVIRRVDPFSVLKLAFFFNLCVFAMCLVAAVLLWSAAIGAGSTDNIESFVVDIGFEDFKLVGADLFRGFFVFGGALVIAFTVFAMLLALLFNLISDIVGGIRLTVIEPLVGDAAGGGSQGADAE